MLSSGNTHHDLVMFAAGVGIPVMAAMNASLGMRLASPPAAASVLFAAALIVALAAMAVTGPPSIAAFRAASPITLFAGLLIAFYVLSITVAAPRIGLGNAVFLVLVGQIVAAALIDHFGLFGAPRSALDIARLAGIALMAAGLYLARRPV